jgi:hypothetical protein
MASAKGAQPAEKVNMIRDSLYDFHPLNAIRYLARPPRYDLFTPEFLPSQTNKILDLDSKKVV